MLITNCLSILELVLSNHYWMNIIFPQKMGVEDSFVFQETFGAWCLLCEHMFNHWPMSLMVAVVNYNFLFLVKWHHATVLAQAFRNWKTNCYIYIQEPGLAGYENKSVSHFMYPQTAEISKSERASGQRADPVLGNQFIPLFPVVSQF